MGLYACDGMHNYHGISACSVCIILQLAGTFEVEHLETPTTSTEAKPEKPYGSRNSITHHAKDSND